MLDAAAQPLVAIHNPDHHGCRGNGEARWCVAQTHPQAERWANANLQRLGYATYLPLYAAQRRDRATPTLRHTVLAPLFPRYVFVQHANALLWRPIREAPGVNAVLTSGNRIQWVRAGAVEALQRFERDRHQIHQPGPQWRCGAAVRVARGIFAGHPGVVTAVDHEAVTVSVLFLGQLRSVALAADSVEARDA